MNERYKLAGVTFTGVDAKTDLGELWSIQQEYPYVEWGILASENWRDNGNRYFNPSFLKALDRGLNLSVHLCGRLAREAVNGNMEPFCNWAKGNAYLFYRCQLNISKNKNNPEKFIYYGQDINSYFDEVILQQSGVADCQLYMNSKGNGHVSVLLDASGGNGIDTPINILDSYKVGYAGGITPDNVSDKLKYLLANVNGQFWIDMESGVRTDDWFDLDKVRKVLEICNNILSVYGGSNIRTED